MNQQVLEREQKFGQWSAHFANNLPQELKPLAFCGPGSFREPEIDDCWHPRYLGQSLFFFLCSQALPLIKTAGGGLRRLVLGRLGKVAYFPHPESSIMGITPRSICTVTEQGVETAYCHHDDVKAMSWVVFDPAGREPRYIITRARIIKSTFNLIGAAVRSSLQKNVRNRDGVIALVLTIRWILGLQWAILWMVGLRVRELIQATKPQRICCVHETFPWARVIWSECVRQDIRSVTIQHASITRTKLWYFPTLAEREAGMSLPDEFIVFTPNDQALLEPFFPNTQFRIGCGPRYLRWKERAPLFPPADGSTAPILLVTSVPWWDTEVVIAAAAKLLENRTQPRAIVIRFHPLAVVRRHRRRWVLQEQRFGRLEVSDRTLAEDLGRAGVVLGMNSTVLQEAASQGLPVIVVETPDILSFAPSLGLVTTIQQLQWSGVESEVRRVLTNPSLQQEIGRNVLGLDTPAVRLTP